jgi:hypothetical protein
MIRTIPRSPGFDVHPRHWTVPAPPTSVPADKALMWQAGAALGLPLPDFAVILGVAESTLKSWVAASGTHRTKIGFGYMPTAFALGVARAVLEARERDPGLTEAVRGVLGTTGPLRALYAILRTAYEPQPASEPYEPSPDPFKGSKRRREATTSKQAKPA